MVRDILIRMTRRLLRQQYNSLSEAAIELGNVAWVTHITACAKGKQKTALGFCWKYKRDDYEY